MTLSVGQVVPLVIEKPAVGGLMIARHDGQIVLVGGAIPSERVTARVTSVAKGIAYADVVDILERSPDRREPMCDLACGGNLYAHIAYSAQLSIKSAVIADALARTGRVFWPSPIDVVASPTEGYRLRARLHMRQGQLGVFREGTHELCDAKATRQLLPASCEALEAVARSVSRHVVSAEIELAENIASTERVIHIETPHPVGGTLDAAMANLAELTGLTMASGASSAVVVSGVPWVIDVLHVHGAELALRRHVRAFFQGNRYLLAALASQVVEMVPSRGRVFDLYAGVGVFGLAAAVTRHAAVVAVEGERYAAADLDANARLLGEAAEVSHQSVESFVRRRRPPPDTVIVDPPRTGLTREALTGVVALEAPLLIYVSCDPATFARDARRLIDGGYTIDAIKAFDLFPNTPHVETVAAFRR